MLDYSLINVDKTKAKYIVSLMNCNHFPHGLSWKKTPIENLGITITDNDQVNFLNIISNKEY